MACKDVCVEGFYLWELFEKSSHPLKNFLTIYFWGVRSVILLSIPRSRALGPNFPTRGRFVFRVILSEPRVASRTFGRRAMRRASKSARPSADAGSENGNRNLAKRNVTFCITRRRKPHFRSLRRYRSSVSSRRVSLASPKLRLRFAPLRMTRRTKRLHTTP